MYNSIWMHQCDGESFKIFAIDALCIEELLIVVKSEDVVPLYTISWLQATIGALYEK